MSKQPKVSFLIPAKNRTHELKAALGSCLAQSLEDWEAIVVDDHSESSDLAEVAKAFQDARIKYHRLDDNHHGVSSARNQAIAMAQSDRFITLDSDDLSHPHRAARCLKLLNTNNPELIYTRVRLFSRTRPEGRPKPVLQPFSSPLLEMVNFITNPGTAFTRRAFEAAGEGFRPDLTMAEDYDLYLRMARAGVAIQAVDEEHVSYRKHAQATTANRDADLHAAIMHVRALNQVTPFPLEAIRAHALPELSSNLLNDAAQRSLWTDDRWRT